MKGKKSLVLTWHWMCPYFHIPQTSNMFSHFKKKKKKAPHPKVLKNFLGGRVYNNPLPMQRTQVWSPAPEDCTCRGAAKAVCRSDWVCAPGRKLRPLKPVHPQLALCNERSPRGEAWAPSEEEPPLRTARESLPTATKYSARPEITK